VEQRAEGFMSQSVVEHGEPSTERSGDDATAARPSAAQIAIRLALVALIVIADLATKSLVFAWLEPLKQRGELTYDLHGHPRLSLAGQWLAFMLSTNPGAAFGQLESFPYLLVGGRVVAGVFLVYLLARTPAGRGIFTAALVLVLGGALGNLYDNLFLNLPHEGRPFGPVRDFIDVYFGVFDWHFPTFNLADSCITVGAGLLLLSGVLGERRPKSAAPARQGDPTGA
jgi:signal peptidase II